MNQQITCKVFSKSKTAIDQLSKELENIYTITRAPLRYNEKHEDWEVWIYLLPKNSLGVDNNEEVLSSE